MEASSWQIAAIYVTLSGSHQYAFILPSNIA